MLAGLSHVFKFNPNHDSKGLFASSGVPKSLKSVAELDQVLRVLAERDGHPNIMDMAVAGEKPFGGLGERISRQNMPQIPSKRRKEFLDSLHVNVAEEKVDPLSLKPTQDQLDGHKIGQFYIKMADGHLHEHEPILVSKDGYIIDGHHHWGSYLAYSLIKGVTKKIPAYVVHMDRKTLLEKAQEFTDAHNIERKTISKAEFAHIFKFNPHHHPAGSPQGGQFAKASDIGTGGSDGVEPSLVPVKVQVPKEITAAIEKVAADMGGVKDQHGAAQITEYLNTHYNKEMQAMMDGVHADHRPTIMLHKGDLEKGIPTIWLLGWSNREGTDIHDHVGSAAAITVVRGTVEERAFAFKTQNGEEEVKQSKSKEGLSVGSTLRGLRAGSTVTIGAPYVHEMHGESGNLKHRDITVHGYYPPLDKMHYFVHHKGTDNLFYDGMWDEHGKPDTKVRKGWNCCGPVFKFNPNHEPAGSASGGQFAKSSGATNGNDLSMADYAAKHNTEVSAADVLSKFPKDVRGEIRLAVTKANGLPTTEAMYTDKNGVYDAERRKLHQQIIDKYTSNEAIKNALPAAGEKPTFVVLGGRGGSGKGAFTNGTIKEFDSSKFIHLDADQIKKELPEYKGWNAAQVHDESSTLEKAIRSVLLARGVNIVADRTLRTPSVETDIQRAIGMGYRIEAHYMYVAPHEAAARATKRYIGKGPSARGRLVPVDVVLANKQNETVFDSIKKHASKWSAYNNMGSKPVLIGRGGKE